LRIEPVLGACLRRSGFDLCWHVGFTDGARDGSSRVRRRCRRLLRDRRRFASEGGWRSWHHDPRRLILIAATARMPWWPSSPAVSTGMGMSVIPKCSSPELSMAAEPTISLSSLPSVKDRTLAVLSASQRRAPPRALPRTSTFPRPYTTFVYQQPGFVSARLLRTPGATQPPSSRRCGYRPGATHRRSKM
jgi:hypothetical protein